MKTETRLIFDFSEDAELFKKQLKKRLIENSASQPLEDDDLEFLNAAGVPARAPSEDEFPFAPPRIP